MRRITVVGGDISAALRQIRRPAGLFDPGLMETVAAIIADVGQRGDEALFYHTRRLDDLVLHADNIEVTGEEREAALAEVKPQEEEILTLAAERISAYHSRQLSVLNIEGWWLAEEGIRMGQLIRPLERVGVYAPGGLAAYPSSVLMAAIPARIAGVKEVLLVTPLRRGKLNPLVILAAKLCGIERIFKIGGAQAIAALAYGTKLVPRVDKIVGPGNAYVAAAKKLVYGLVDIDMIAGPSEILIIADDKADPALAAADLLGQAEHDEMACALLVATDQSWADEVTAEIERQLGELPRRDIAGRAWRDYGAVIVVADLDEAVEFANLVAPEHLELLVADPSSLLAKIRHAGCVFLGAATPEAVGDYIAGSNHILPTGGTARFSSPLGVYDFFKRISVVGFSAPALEKYGPAAARFAELEGLTAHARSLTKRLTGRSSSET